MFHRLHHTPHTQRLYCEHVLSVLGKESGNYKGKKKKRKKKRKQNYFEKSSRRNETGAGDKGQDAIKYRCWEPPPPFKTLQLQPHF